MTVDAEVLRRALERERAARKEAERLLEELSRDLFAARQAAERGREATARERDRLRSIGEAVPDLLFALDRDGEVTYAQQDRAATLAARAPHLTPALRAAAARAVETGQAQVFEYDLADGARCEARIARMNDAEAMVVIRDVTRERRAEALLRAQVDEATVERARLERALADTFAAVDGGFWETDLATGSTSWSDATYGLLGYAPGSVAPGDDAFRAHVHPDDYGRMMAAELRAKQVVEFRVCPPGGEVRWCRNAIHASFGPDGAPLRLRGLLTDITAERAVARQLARLAEVASRTENAVVITDLDGRIEWVNDAFTRLTGWTLPEVEGKAPGSFLQGPHTDPTARAQMSSALRAREPFDVEVLNYDRHGRQYWVQVETRLARDEHGQPTGYVAVETDVTARRLEARKDDLTQRVAALLLESDGLEAAAHRLVHELVAELDIRVAQLWVVEPGQEELVYVAGASDEEAGEAGRTFLELSRATSFRPGPERVVGVGLPGVAVGTGRPYVLDDFSHPTSRREPSRRLEAATAADIRTACAAPILGPDGVLGVIEFGGTHYYPGHELLPPLIQRVAEQVAAFMLHDVSRRAFRAVFDQSPDALLLVGADGAVAAANARAVALFGPLEGRAVDALIEGAAALVRGALEAPSAAAAAPVRLFNLEARGAAGAFAAEVSVAATPSSTTQAAILAVRDLTERLRMEAALTRSLREKDTLLREVHHRVKNNLQIVGSLLTLQAEMVAEPRARDALEQTVYRVRSMALVHQQLYGTADLASVHLGEYARSLCAFLQGSVDASAQLELRADRVEVPIDQAVPCGLILNELVTNALKHGRSADGACRIDVEIRAGALDFTLEVRDQGPGLPTSRGAASASLGARLIGALVRQLRGKMTSTSDGGARVAIVVPRDAPPPA